MRIRPLLLFAPVLFAGSLLVATPAPAAATGGLTETGTTSYVVNPVKGTIDVTIKLSDYSTKAPDASHSYFYNATEIVVEVEAGPVTATSNAGRVTQSIIKTSNYYRYIKLNYPGVGYGGTRVITATYSIPAGPRAPGNFRAGSSYVSLCADGNGWDSGSVSITLPDDFTLYVDDGGDLTKSTSAPAGQQTWTSGPQASPYKFWTCVDAENASALTHTPVTSAGQKFDIESWPEDTTWTASISAQVTTDVKNLEDLTGLTMPGGTIQIREAGDFQLGNAGGMYNSATSIAEIPETIRKDTVAHELSHIWFNRQLIKDKWVSEGLAGYSEQAAGPGNFIACKEPGTYPDPTGDADLMTWASLDAAATATDQAIIEYQYAASCYIFTKLSDDMGAANFKTVLKAMYGHEMAYIGATPNEKLTDSTSAITAKQMLDFIDERGMVPGGATDLDAAGNLLSNYGIFTTLQLTDRSASRTTYHALVKSAKKWSLPLAVRQPMNDWKFTDADAAMTTAKQILDTRDAIEKQLSGFSVDSTSLKKQFESAKTQGDLDALLIVIKREADAASKVDEATKLKNGNRSIIETLGLLGTDVEKPLAQAKTDLANLKTDSAKANAQTVIDSINKSSSQGVTRIATVVGGFALILILIALAVFFRGRRRRAKLAMAAAGPGFGPPGFAAPGFGAPGYGAPGYGTPGYGTPGYGTPTWGQPAGPGMPVDPNQPVWGQAPVAPAPVAPVPPAYPNQPFWGQAPAVPAVPVAPAPAWTPAPVAPVIQPVIEPVVEPAPQDPAAGTPPEA